MIGDETPVAQQRRERRKLATRRAIQLAALRLAVERGPEHVTVQAISDAADIAPRTFFTYFSSRDEALAIENWSPARLREMLGARPPEEPPMAAVRAVAKDFAAEMAAEPERMRLITELARCHPNHVHHPVNADEACVQVVIEDIAARTGLDSRNDAYPAVAGWSVWIAAKVALQRWSEQTGGADPPDRFFDEAFDILERGL